MKKHPFKSNYYLAILVAGLFLAGCATVPHPLYKAVTDIPPGQGVVYFYCPKDEGMTLLMPGTYCVQFQPAGTNYYKLSDSGGGGIFEGWLVTKQKPGMVRVYIKAGKSYYFRVVSGGILRVRNATGKQEIAQCRLVKDHFLMFGTAPQ